MFVIIFNEWNVFLYKFHSFTGLRKYSWGPFGREVFQTEAGSGIERGLYRSTKNF